jgi:hypothetical protein
VDEACSTHGEKRNACKIVLESLKGRNHTKAVRLNELHVKVSLMKSVLYANVGKRLKDWHLGSNRVLAAHFSTLSLCF